MNEENQKVVKDLVVELLGVMGLNAIAEEERIEEIEGGESIYTINLKTEDPSLLIGQYGANLQSFQHLVGVMTRKKFLEKKDIENEEMKFNIDVNDYKKQKRESLIKLADTIANQVLYSKNSVALRPMSSYERKIIHTEISVRKNLATESIGEDIARRIVVKYVE
jgi:spoIIIJ-associated protein